MSYIEDLTQVLSYVAAFGCVVMSIPSILIGAIASVTGESCHIKRILHRYYRMLLHLGV